MVYIESSFLSLDCVKMVQIESTDVPDFLSAKKAKNQGNFKEKIYLFFRLVTDRTWVSSVILNIFASVRLSGTTNRGSLMWKILCGFKVLLQDSKRMYAFREITLLCCPQHARKCVHSYGRSGSSITNFKHLLPWSWDLHTLLSQSVFLNLLFSSTGAVFVHVVTSYI